MSKYALMDMVPYITGRMEDLRKYFDKPEQQGLKPFPEARWKRARKPLRVSLTSRKRLV